jgi:hypothetical protein
MWSSAALIAALTLTPAQPGGLSVKNVHPTYGAMGATRPDSKYPAGDELFLAFDVEGVKPDANGTVRVGVGMELIDGKGNRLFTQAPKDRTAVNSLGGTTMPLFAKLDIGTDQPAGSYVLKLTVTDKSTGAKDTAEFPFEVLPKAFALVRVKTAFDPEGDIPAPHIGVGQALFLHFSAVNFTRNPSTKQPNLKAEMRIVDEGGNATLPSPAAGVVDRDIPEGTPGVPMKFLVNLNRSGKFTVELTVTDTLTRKAAKMQLPLDVLKAR